MAVDQEIRALGDENIIVNPKNSQKKYPLTFKAQTNLVVYGRKKSDLNFTIPISSERDYTLSLGKDEIVFSDTFNLEEFSYILIKNPFEEISDFFKISSLEELSPNGEEFNKFNDDVVKWLRRILKVLSDRCMIFETTLFKNTTNFPNIPIGHVFVKAADGWTSTALTDAEGSILELIKEYTNLVKKNLDAYVENPLKPKLDKHEKEKEAELDRYTVTKEEEISNFAEQEKNAQIELIKTEAETQMISVQHEGELQVVKLKEESALGKNEIKRYVEENKIALKGDKGERGPQGTQGIQGIEGPQGPRGNIGPQGLKGPQGEVGPRGSQGIQGLKGDKGDRGEAGANGISIPIVSGRFAMTVEGDNLVLYYNEGTTPPKYEINEKGELVEIFNTEGIKE